MLAHIRSRLRAEAAGAAGPGPRPGAVPPPLSSPPGPSAHAPGTGTALCSSAQPPLPSAHLDLSRPPTLTSPPDGPQACAYYADAVTKEHGDFLLAAVDHASHAPLWVELRARRLQQWAAPLPPFLASLADDLVEAGVFPAAHQPNSVLINAYEAEEGILPHTDGPRYHPIVATLSLGGPALMRYSVLFGRERAERGERGGDTVGVLVLRPRSLVVTSGELYSAYAHSIPEGSSVALAGAWGCEQGQDGAVLERDERRVSLTLRHTLAERA